MTLPYVFGWQADRAGCGYYRVEVPLREYARRGGPCSFSTGIEPEVYDQADIIVGQRIVGPEPSRAWQKWCKHSDKLCVFEVDDDLFNIHPSNIAYASFTPEYLGNLRKNIEVAHAVTVTTPFLANMLRPLNDNIHVVPNRIPQWVTEFERPRAEHLTLGWAGSTSHVIDWQDTAPHIARFLDRNPEVHFHGVGGIFKSMLKFPLDRTRTTQWNHSVDEYYKALDFDIGMIPLYPNLFNRSKSAVKALEYGALGIPTVASHFEPYENYIIHGKTGYLVTYDHEWSGILRDLANDPVRRAKMGFEAREQAKQHTIEGNLESWFPAWGIDALL